jgi:serine/threonine-protein kinase RsbW
MTHTRLRDPFLDCSLRAEASLFRGIRDLERAWREQAQAGETPADGLAAGTLREYYRQWARLAEARCRQLEELSEFGQHFPAADDFRHCLAEAREILAEEDPGVASPHGVEPLRGPHRPQLAWREEILTTAAEVSPATRRVVNAMAGLGYPEGDRFAMRLALQEALVNAVKHGNGGDPAKRVRLRYRVSAACVELEVEDQGEGFDPAGVPDPCAPENLERPCGRGLLMMRHYLDEVHYHGRGNRVTLRKRRSPA